MLGKGKYSLVFEAQHLNTGKKVALKILKQSTFYN